MYYWKGLKIVKGSKYRYDILTRGQNIVWNIDSGSIYRGSKYRLTPARIHRIHNDVMKWNHFRVTGPLWGESTRSFHVFFDLRLNKRLHKQLRRRWFRAHLWRHCNVFIMVNTYTSTEFPMILHYTKLFPLILCQFHFTGKSSFFVQVE